MHYTASQVQYPNNIDSNTPVQGAKALPHSEEVEQVVLGSMLIDSFGLSEAIAILNPEVFYNTSNKAIYVAIERLFLENSGIDLITVSNALKSNGNLAKVGGVNYLIELTKKVSSSAHIEYHCRILLQLFIKRQIIYSANTLLSNAYNQNIDVFDLMDDAYRILNDTAEISIKPKEKTFSGTIESVIEKSIKISNKEITAGLPMPIDFLQQDLGGWKNGELTIIAGRPGMGKTAFAINCITHLAKKDEKVALFSLEMNANAISSRIISSELFIDLREITVSGLSPYSKQSIKENKHKIKDLPIIIDDNAGVTIEQLQIKANRLKSKHDVKAIFVDYLQLISAKSDNRVNEISRISRSLKQIAQNLDIPVIALSQLSRAVENRPDKRPQLSDLRDSGAIEQDADVVMFIYRPEYYGITEWTDLYNMEDTENQAEIIVAKNRQGKVTQNRTIFSGRFTKFSNIKHQFTEEIQPNNMNLNDVF